MSHLFKLRDYQSKIIEDVILHLETNQRCCVSLATGGGKTVVFSELVSQFFGKILICVHREELVYQTSSTLTLEHKLIVPKKSQVGNITIAMVQTLNNRIKKQEININDFDYIIIDECHRGEFMKILENYKGKVIGFTATPNYEKNIYYYVCPKCGNEFEDNIKCCNKLEKFRQKLSLSKYYDTLINGIEINELIEQGFLVQDENFVLNVDTSELVFNEATKEYTEESIALVYGAEKAIKNTVDTFKELCFGKKTIIFNPNTVVNKLLYEAMLIEGINAKMYDSKNSEENRSELIDWFKNTKDAVLLNIQIFTTGFDCTDVEVIFLNKKTQSLNLYLQMIGRGGRITDKIFKPKFKVIDMGNNFKEFGSWSNKRDWSSIFYNETKEQIKYGGVQRVRTCHSCEAIISANSLICPECKEVKLFKGGVVGFPIKNNKIIPPDPNKIIDFCEKNNLDCVTARKIVFNMVADLFENTSKEVYLRNKNSGQLYARTYNFIRPYYFAIQSSKIEGNKIRTLMHFTNQAVRTIDKKYE